MSTAGFLGAAHARRTRPDLTPVLRERISMPLLLVAGEEDPVRVGTELIAEELPSAAYVMFKGAGHPVPVNAPTAWRDVVLDFLADVEDGKVKSGKRVV
jgi:pimeloyl-ACP methyl ester carboxylesterase